MLQKRKQSEYKNRGHKCMFYLYLCFKFKYFCKELFKKIKKRFIISLQILKMQKFKCFKEKTVPERKL